MCLILFSFRAHRHFPLVVAANRDEHFSRPAAAATFWDDHPAVYAGRDLEQGGTWMGINTNGRFAAVTNYRQGRPGAAAPRSRGALVGNFLTGDSAASAYMAGIDGSQYNPYSLIAGDIEALYFHSNRGSGVVPVATGVHGLSNHLLDTPWPKVTAGIAALAATRNSDDPDAIGNALFALLSEQTPAREAQLPDTGIDRQRERELSPPFILGDLYGTRTSTLLLVHASGDVFVHEKRYGPGGRPQGEDARAFRLENAARTVTS
ncbi:MAG: NRDE family protein [Burkholderiales bacterium]|nr:NRDE family protein [Burkholderiales bacterium]